VQKIVESRWFTIAITVVIVINAITLGLETWPEAMRRYGTLLVILDTVALGIFVVEIAMKLWVYRMGFFKNGWNVFDFTIVAIALIPSAGALSVLRAMRILRVLRLISVVPQMRTVVGALFGALPGMGSIVAVLLLVFYVTAVMATKLFGESFPAWFGSIGESMYSLFQIMTLESWSMGIVRPVMEQHPYAWVFFVPFVIVTSFAVLNLFIALIVNSMNSVHAEERESAVAAEHLAHDEREHLMTEIQALRADVQALNERVRAQSAGDDRKSGTD